MYQHHILFIYSPVNGQKSYLLTIVNNAVKNKGIQISV